MKHITKLALKDNGCYITPMLGIYWTNGFGIIIGWLRFAFAIHIQNKFEFCKPLFQKKIYFNGFVLYIDFSGIMLLPLVSNQGFGFLFFSIEKIYIPK